MALFPTESLKDPNLPNIDCMVDNNWLYKYNLFYSLPHYTVASFKVVSANKYKAQQELDAFKNKE